MNFDELIALGETRLKDRVFYPYFDVSTYCTESLFRGFQDPKTNQHKMLKLIWAWDNAPRYDLDPFELAAIAPDRCPVFLTPLDYGMGKNRVFDPQIEPKELFFRPWIDHVIARANGGENSIGNSMIVCGKANTYKNDMDSLDTLDRFYMGMRSVYYPASVA